ncbi:MAG: spore cortex biosynthesis protein YabQ [Bacillota bacterium]
METINYQFSSLVMAVFNGMALALWYDLYRLCKGIFRWRGFGLLCGDFFFWVVSTIVTIGFLFISSWGDVRIYVFLAMSVGAWFYFTAFSSMVLHALTGPVRFIHKAMVRLKVPVPGKRRAW